MAQSPRQKQHGRTYGGETQAERKARRRGQFLKAGLAVFGELGYRQATVRHLCREAELTDRYFYEEFGSTEDLLLAVYVDCLERIRHGLLESVMQTASPNVDALIRAALDAFFAVIEDSRLARVVWLEVLGVSPRVDKVYTEGVRGFAELLIQLAQLVYPGLDRTHEVQRMLAVSLVGSVSEAAKQWLMNDYRESRAVMVEATAPVFLGIIPHLARLSAAAR